MASKKVIVNIKVNQDGAKVSDVTKDVKKLTDAEKERIKVRNDLKKTDAQIEIVNEDITKTLKERKSVLKDLASQQLTSSQIAKIAAKKKKEDTEEQIRIEKKAFNEKKRIESNNASIDSQRSRALISQFNAQEKLTQKTIESAQAQELLNKNLQQFKTTSGLSGAIVTEFGRTVSDLPFGIRGVGNNLAQLGSLFGSLAVNAKKAGGGIKDAIGQILVSFKGIVGFITVFQVFVALLQTEFFQKFLSGLAESVGALDLFKDRLKDVKDVLKEASETAGSSIGNFKLYTRTIQDSNASLESQQEALKRLNQEYPDYDSSVITSTDSTKNATLANDEYVKSLRKRAISLAATTKFNEQESIIQDNILQKKLKQEEEAKKLGFDNFEEVKLATIKAAKELEDIDKVGSERAKTRAKDGFRAETQRVIKQSSGRILKITNAQLIELSELEKFGEKKIKEARRVQDIVIKDIEFSAEKESDLTTKSSERKVKIFKEGNLSLQKELQRAEKDAFDTISRSNLEIIKREGEDSKNIIAIKRNEFVEKEQLRLKDFIAQKNIDKQRKGITDKEKKAIQDSITQAKAISEETIRNARSESEEVIDVINVTTDARIKNQSKLDAIEKLKSDNRVSESQGSLDVELTLGIVGQAEAQKKLNEEIFNNQQEQSALELERLDLTENERNRILEESKIRQQERRNEELEDEIRVNDAKIDVVTQYTDFVGGIGGVLKLAAGENKKLQKAALFAEKGAAVASVVTDAIKTNFQISATGKALAIPTGGASLVSSGLLKAKNIANASVSIASIIAGGASSLKRINAGDSGSSETKSSPQQAPDFNIIGSTGVNQLADAIGGTTGQSVKAYVVSSDITNQQALDRSINESAQI